MRIVLEPTDLMVPFGPTMTRCWKGETDGGVRIVACVALIAARAEADCEAFERALAELPADEAAPGAAAMRKIGGLL